MAELTWWQRHKPALIVFVVIFGLLLYVATRDFYPKRRVKPEYLLPRVEVTADKPFPLEWPRRWEKPPAPPFSMDLPLTAFAGWMSSGKIEVQQLSTGHDRQYLFTTLPDPGELSVKSLGVWCPAGLESEDCSLAELRLLVMEDAPDASDAGWSVMNSTARGSSDAEVSGPRRRLNAFWVKENRAAGRLDFVGWDCEGEPPTGTPSTDVSKPLIERNRCFEPPTVAERRTPKKAGYQRFVQMTACASAGRACKLYFAFRGRYIEAETMQTPMTAKSEQDTGFLFLASWEFLNRLYGDTWLAPSVQVRLARASNSLENCRAILARVERVDPADLNKRNELRDWARWHCTYAAQVASSALEESPDEAAAITRAALEGSSFAFTGRGEKLLRTAVAVTGKSAKPDSRQMAEAQYALARGMADAEWGSPPHQEKRAALKEALRIADATLPTASDTHIAIYRSLAYHMQVEKEPDEKIALLEQWQDAVRRGRGSRDPAMRLPTHQLCSDLETLRRPERLKDCADTYLPFWLDAAANDQSTSSHFTNGTATIGLDLLRWYSGYGITQNKPREVLPTMRKIEAILKPRVGANIWETQGATAIRYTEDRLPPSERGGAR